MIDKIISLLENRSTARNAKRIKEILEFRRILEPEIAARAAQALEPGDLAILKAILDSQEKNMAENVEDAHDDLRFHLTLARATKNDVLVEVIALVHDILKECRVAPLQDPARKRASLQGHRKILAALSEKDSDLSRTAMLNHLTEVDSLLYGD
jgi:GntR family transcriptional regulator, transcriptional repressor for pyruvate dehydrogenase complex